MTYYSGMIGMISRPFSGRQNAIRIYSQIAQHLAAAAVSRGLHVCHGVRLAQYEFYY